MGARTAQAAVLWVVLLLTRGGAVAPGGTAAGPYVWAQVDTSRDDLPCARDVRLPVSLGATKCHPAAHRDGQLRHLRHASTVEHSWSANVGCQYACICNSVYKYHTRATLYGGNTSSRATSMSPSSSDSTSEAG